MTSLLTRGFTPAVLTTFVLLNIFAVGSEVCAGSARAAANPDSTLPGQGTGLSGLGKGPSPVPLGAAGGYAILAKTGISMTGTTAVTGDLGVSPAAGSYITGFDLLAPPTTFATSVAVTGKVFASDYDSPTPSNLTTAISDLQTALTDAAGRSPDYSEQGAGSIGGMTLAPAVYKWSTDVLIPSDVTLAGGPNDVWIFQIAGDLKMESGVAIVLAGGALPKNIFWQVSGAVDLETTSHFEGVAICQTAIILKTGATANSRLLAETAVVLDANTVVQPAADPEVTGIIMGTVRNRDGVRFVPMGDRLAVELAASASARTVSIFGMDGMVRGRVPVPAGQTRIDVPVSLSPSRGFLFQVK
jgi:hypothetical protein